MSSVPSASTGTPSRSGRWLRVVPWLVAAGGVYVVGLALQGETMPTGEPAPDLRVTLATEANVALTQQAAFDLSAQRGRVVVLNFWADWCPPCRAEAPALSAVARELEARGDVLLGLAVERRSLGSVERLGMHYPHAYAPPELAERYKVSMLPTTVVIDPEGRVAEVFVGGVEADALREATEDARRDAD